MSILKSLLTAVVLAVAAAAVTLRGVNEPSQAFWDKRSFLFYGAVALVAVGAVLPAVAKAFRHGSVERTLRRTRNVETSLKGAFLRIHEATGIPVRELGVEAYLKVRERRHPFKPVLVRYGQVRLTASKRSGHIRWIKGKGVLGTVWTRGGYLVVNVTALPDDWTELPEKDRLGMSEDEARSISDYGAIAAHPIFDSVGRVRGSVTADAPPSRLRQLNGPVVQQELSDAAAAVWIAALSSADEA